MIIQDSCNNYSVILSMTFIVFTHCAYAHHVTIIHHNINTIPEICMVTMLNYINVSDSGLDCNNSLHQNTDKNVIVNDDKYLIYKHIETILTQFLNYS